MRQRLKAWATNDAQIEERLRRRGSDGEARKVCYDLFVDRLTDAL